MLQEMQDRLFQDEPNDNCLMQMYLDPTVKGALKTITSERSAKRAKKLVMESAKARVPSRFYIDSQTQAAVEPPQQECAPSSSVAMFDLSAQLNHLSRSSTTESQGAMLQPKSVMDLYEGISQADINNSTRFTYNDNKTEVIKSEFDILHFWAHMERRMPGDMPPPLLD